MASPSLAPLNAGYCQIGLTLLDQVNVLRPKDPDSYTGPENSLDPSTEFSSYHSGVSFFPFTSRDACELEAKLREKYARYPEIWKATSSGDVESLIESMDYGTNQGREKPLKAEVKALLRTFRRRRQKVERMKEMAEKWEGLVAISGGQRVILARCTSPQPIPTPSSDPSTSTERDATSSSSPSFSILLQHALPDTEELYTIALSYDPIMCTPVIVCGGVGRVVYVLDIWNEAGGADDESGTSIRVRRVLRGHGDAINSVKFHPTKPHIIASGSADKTARLWNISATGSSLSYTKDPLPAPFLSSPSSRVPPKEDENLASWDFARADADEPTSSICIFAGEGQGGHRAACVDVAFHPTRNLIVTCGTDYQVRIWAIPPERELPEAGMRHERTGLKDGYRPHVVYLPLFATGRLHISVVDCIEWISEDVLVSKTESDLIVWQWLGFKRFFPGEDPEPLARSGQKADFKNSHSFRMIARHGGPKTDKSIWFLHFGIHRAFTPADNVPGNRNFLALGKFGAEPSIVLLDPGSWESKQIVPDVPDFGLRKVAAQHGTIVRGDSEDMESRSEKMDDGETIEINSSASSVELADEPEPYPTVPNLKISTLHSQDLRKALKHLRPGRDVWTVETYIRHVGISPGGAEWIVGVGDRGLIVVYHRENGT